MARKTLLSEGEVRQFMKLANLGPLSENYLDEQLPGEEEEGLPGEEEVAVDAELEVDDVAPPEGGGEMVSLDDFMAALEQAVEDVTGQPTEVSDEGGEETLDADLEVGDEEVGMDVGLDEEPGYRDMAEEKEGYKQRLSQHLGKDPGKGKASKKAREHESEGEEEAEGKPKFSGNPESSQTENQELDEIGGRITHDTSRPATGRESSARMAARGAGGGRAAKTDEDCPVGHVAVDGKCVPARAGAGKEAGGRMSQQQSDAYEASFGLEEDAIVAEVARRVAARLMANEKKENMAEALAERIFARLTTK